ncbi:MAG: hypothetical protein ABFD98_03505 [Syntrophobacteraceae bacterium]|nr:hypothetical protein [Desulfobacteraceae bacterium]
MRLEETTRWRDRVARTAAVFFVLFVCAAFDGLIALYRQPVNSSYAMPGESVRLNGPLPVDSKGLEELSSTSDNDALRLTFDEVFAGFWLGGRMWRGTLSVGPAAASGEYHVSVSVEEETPQKNPTVFTVFVYRTDGELRGYSYSFLRRSLDLNSWWTAAAFLVFMGLTVSLVYMFSSRRESLLAEVGMADIYRISHEDGRCEVAFALGTLHGVVIGSKLEILDGPGRVLGQVEVVRISETDSIAEVEPGVAVEPGHMVRKTG